jgi:hypothetical protein
VPEYKKDREIPEAEDKSARIRWVTNQFNRYEEYWRPEIERLIRNQRFMWGVGFGQWPSYVVEKLRVQGRRPPTFNIIAKKIEAQIGSFLANGFDMKYTPVNGNIDSLTNKLLDMFYCDKSNLDWETAEIIALRDCFNMIGYERMYISDQYNEMGNIAFEPVNPAHVYLDIGWKDYDVNNINHYFTWSMMTPSEIMSKYKTKSEYIRNLKEREERDGINLGYFNGGVNLYKTTEDKWGDRHKVIEYHSLKTKEIEWEYDLINHCNFPETGFEIGSKDDQDAKIQYIMAMGLNPETDIVTIKRKMKTKMVEAFVPTLDDELFLTSGKDKIQTQNCNIYPIGNSYNGQYKGTTDELYDVQLSINKGEMNLDDMQMRAAKGAFILDRALSGGDSSVEREIEANWNNPAARIWVDENATANLGQHGGVIPLPGVSDQSPYIAQVNRKYDLADVLSMVPAAMEARTEHAGESGRLFQSKVQVGMISQRYYMKIYERHKRAKAMAYTKQAKITYAGFPREFTSKDGGDTFVINQRVSDGYGRRYVLDDISKLPEMKVILVPSSSGINIRTEARAQYSELLPLLNDPNDRLLKLVFVGGIFDTLPDMSEETKEEIKMALNLLKSNSAMEQAVMNMQLKGTLQQAGMAKQQQQQATPVPQQASQEPPQQISAGEPSEEVALEGTPQQETPEFLSL